MRVEAYRLTRFQYRRERVIGDSQVRATCSHIVAVELIAGGGVVGLGFGLSLFHALPSLAELNRVFEEECWPGLRGQPPAALVHRVSRPRGGNVRGYSQPFGEAINVALWDLAAKQAGLPLWRMLGGETPRVRTYASGLDFHLSDAEYEEFFGQAAALGFQGFKIKVGHPDVEWDLNRLHLLRRATGGRGAIMIDSNEAWSAKETLRRLELFRRAGHEILWMEDPCLRDDHDALREVREGAPWVHINTGEYLDLRGKRKLIEGRAVDILNVHGHVSDVMRAGWLAAEYGLPVSLGNTMLELGVHAAVALPEVGWLEYSFQNYNHIVEQPYKIVDSYITAPDVPGHGLTLDPSTAVPDVLAEADLPAAPLSSPIRLAA